MAFRANRRLLSLLIAMLFAIGSLGHVYAATKAMMTMPTTGMVGSSHDHDMDCGGNDKGSRSACVALCATSVAILADPLLVSSATVQRVVEPLVDLAPPSCILSPEQPPPKR